MKTKRQSLCKLGTLNFLLMLLLTCFIPNHVKADTYECLNVSEDHIEVRLTNYNVCWWTKKVQIHTYMNAVGQNVNAYTFEKGGVTFKMFYKGREGTNQVWARAVVCGTEYPYEHKPSLDFIAPAIGAPKNVVSTTNKIDVVTIEWESTTAYADADVTYNIYNADNGGLLKTVSGDTRSVDLTVDNVNVRKGVMVNYRVETSLKGTNRVSNSSLGRASGMAFGFNMRATEKLDDVYLEWETNPTYLADGYFIKRDGVSLTIEPIHKNVDDFSDGSAAPGIYYTYQIISAENPEVFDSCVGRRKPNGIIEGYVKTAMGIGVGGVTVRATRQDVADEDEYATIFEAVSSSEDGKYSIKSIYYGDSSTFKVSPVLGSHGFDPDTLTRDLSQGETNNKQTDVNFTDTTALSIQGIVTQQGAPLEGVSIMAVGETLPSYTDRDGRYNITVSQPGKYEIIAEKDGHEFEEVYNELVVLDNILLDSEGDGGINFTDTATVLVSGYFTASCRADIGTATLRFFTDNGFLNYEATTMDSSYFEVRMPMTAYNVELKEFLTLPKDVDFEGEVKDYFSKQVLTINLDSVAVNDSASYNLVYRLAPSLNVEFVNTPETYGGDTLIVEQNKITNVVIHLEEVFNGNVCPVDEGKIIIEQELTSDDIITDTIYFNNGIIDTIQFNIGVPNIIAPYLKTFRVTAHVGGYTNFIDKKVMVVGHHPRTSTFTSVSPSIPFLILHDPPGDGSYSFYEKSTSFSSSFSLSGSLTMGGAVTGAVKTGVKLIKGQFVLTESNFNVEVSQSIGLSLQMNSESSWDTEVTFAEGYQTSSDDGTTGGEGDLYVGAALNIIYGITDVVEYDFSTGKALCYQTLAVEPDGFAFETEFIYSEKHIIDFLIPELERLRDLSPYSEKLKYDKQINEWQQVVANNHANIEDALFIKNVSFGGNTSYRSSIEGASSLSQTISTSLSITNHTEINAEFEESGSGVSAGVEIDFGVEVGSSESHSLSKTVATGFELYDDDDGDAQSVNIKRDKVYGTPVFEVVAGKTSCPWEVGTLPREGVQLRADKYSVKVEDPTDMAVFELELANTSESNEENTYDLTLVSGSNPDGAVVTVGGSPVVGGIPTPFEGIEAGKSTRATVTVQKGPNSYIYNGLKFRLESQCDGSISDEVILNVEFESNCGTITLTPEEPTPLVTSLTSSIVTVNVLDYTKENLTSINIERRNEFSAWETIKILAGDDIGINNTLIPVSFENVADHVYYLRALANCSNASVATEEVKITVDRSAPQFTVLNPANMDSMQVGEAIYALFDEDIKQVSEDDIRFINKVTGEEIGYQFGLSNNKLIFLPNNDDIVDGDTLSLTINNIEDVYGNSTGTTSLSPSWSFVVPTGKGIWEDPNLDSDLDGVPDSEDLCIFGYNPFQEDADNDGIGDICDDDIDGDGILNIVDNCTDSINVDQADDDGDGIGNMCDEDVDGDGIINTVDNCPLVNNLIQTDIDFDGIGDACDPDIDGDGIENDVDNCPTMANADQADADANGIGDVCENSTGINQGQNCQMDVVSFPNPFSDQLIFKIHSPMDKKGRLELFDITGRYILISEDVNLTVGNNTISFNTNHLTSGIYIYKFSFKDAMIINKVVK